MKRQISICIFLAIIVVALTLLYIKFNNESTRESEPQNVEETQNSTEEQGQSITSSKEYITYYFYAKDEDGHISIYDVKSQTLYMETGIESDLLPDEIRVQLEAGIYFENEEQLYSFLESYSS